MADDDFNVIDPSRSACLCDLGCGYAAVVAVAADGSEHLVLAERSALGDDSVTYDPTCAHVAHEQVAELPLEFVRRLAISRRTNTMRSTEPPGAES